MGVLLVCILVGVISLCIIIAITDSQQTQAKNNKEKLFERIRSVCEDNNITYEEPIGFLKSLGEYAGYKYEYHNEVSLVNKKGLRHFYWIDKCSNNLCFVGDETAYTIPVDRIEMYTTDGSIRYSSIVKNNGKNVSLSGAIVGSVIAGVPGMIIGATKDRNNIDTEVKETDERKIYIYYRNENDEVESLVVEKSFYDSPFLFDSFLERELPTKSEKYLLANQTIQNNVDEKSSSNTSSSSKILKELKELYDDGLITEDEYNEKKKDILNKMV